MPSQDVRELCHPSDSSFCGRAYARLKANPDPSAAIRRAMGRLPRSRREKSPIVNHTLTIRLFEQAGRAYFSMVDGSHSDSDGKSTRMTSVRVAAMQNQVDP